VSLVVLDVDRFKAINDTHGHQTGDEVLRAVGGVLAHECRGADLAARYGGEEFAIILPDTPPRQGQAVAERLRRAVAAAQSPVAVTVSAGIASWPHNADDATGLLGAADAALYVSKDAGRDRTTRSRRRQRTRVAATTLDVVAV
jgi:diguanylate cyclase (GGDEF)-like protein